jgi:hypothetical protein
VWSSKARVEWINLAQDRVKWVAVENTAVNREIYRKEAGFLNRWAPVSFSEMNIFLWCWMWEREDSYSYIRNIHGATSLENSRLQEQREEREELLIDLKYIGCWAVKWLELTMVYFPTVLVTE